MFYMLTEDEQTTMVEVLEEQTNSWITKLVEFKNDNINTEESESENSKLLSVIDKLIEILPDMPAVLKGLGSYFGEISSMITTDLCEIVETAFGEEDFTEIESEVKNVVLLIFSFYSSTFSLWNDTPQLKYPLAELLNIERVSDNYSQTELKNDFISKSDIDLKEESINLRDEIFAIIMQWLGIRSQKDYILVSDEDYYPDDYSGYVWPIRPGKIEWTELEDHREKTDLLQIPEDILVNMSTYELVESVISYPLNCDVFSYESTNTWFEIAQRTFNGLDELTKRDDASTAMCKHKTYCC